MPEYLHPSVHTRIIDNSFVAQTAQGNTTLFAAFRSEIGRDNQIVELNSVSDALFEYGTPNMSKYGQGLYNVLNWLQNGGKVYAIRILPTETINSQNRPAAYQYGVLSIDTNTRTKSIRAHVKHSPVGNTTLAGLKAKVELSESSILNDVDTEGYISYPLAVFHPRGRGTGYKLGVQFVVMDSLDATFEFRTYSAYITTKDSTGADIVLEGPFTVALDPLARNKNRESLYFANVINKYSQHVSVITSDATDYYDNIANYIKGTIVDQDLRDATSPFALDFFTGLEKSGTAVNDRVHSNVVFENTPVTNPGRLDIAQYMGSGHDGLFGSDTEDQLLNAAYGAILTPEILDKKQYEIDVVLDANYASSVKNKIHEFCSSMREDCMALLDCSFQANVQQTLAFRSEHVGMSDFRTAVFSQDFIVYDEYNGSNIKVTPTFFLARKIPQVDDQLGLHYTFVGPRRGVISGFEAINFLPNEMEKENMYKQQINYIEKDPKRYNFGSQLTSQKVSSALSDINNVRTLLRIRRDVERIMDEYRFEFNDSSTHESMNYNLNGYLVRWIANRACKTISGLVYASDYDRQQKIVRVRVELTFTGIIERVFVDIVVNR